LQVGSSVVVDSSASANKVTAIHYHLPSGIANALCLERSATVFAVEGEQNLKVVLIHIGRSNPAYGIKNTTWRIEGTPSGRNAIIKAIEVLVSKLSARYTSDLECVLKVIAPNEAYKSTPQLKICSFDREAIVDYVCDLMTQSGGVYFQLQELEFHIAVIDSNFRLGHKIRPVVNSAKSHCIISIKTIVGENNSMGRALVVGLAVNQKLGIFKNNLTVEEIKAINYKKANKTQLNEGVVSNAEINQIKGSGKYKIQGILANALHRLADVEFKLEGNNFADLDKFGKFLCAKIVVYDLNTKGQIFNGGTESLENTLSLLLNNDHYDYLVKTTLAFPEKLATHIMGRLL
jgi:hypothetical protein